MIVAVVGPKEKIAIIDCEFIDETGKSIDNTPVFQHISLLKPPLKEMFTPPSMLRSLLY